MDHRAAGSPRRNTFVLAKTLSCFDLAVHTFCPVAANFRLNHEKPRRCGLDVPSVFGNPTQRATRDADR
ncbi:hypothetical protein O7628_01530 [Micromonospora sp. WMMD956]|uniref:hypothetical protein n=1 Tax=Micromonospora TaxID=1873 RepID=UPI0024162EA9|nr:hypothetical protein [Micromonospora sp. WMMD956]MDG4814189.1 hypothetical protein [Micromonospora sp. WMMD956]